ncbi:hypothetical protein Btru_003135 [Bulinus truncatus]|nr:hypothetical protein Btru_003135 [Bulinus truncatus]
MASSKVSHKHILLTGIPGVGKTTLIKRIYEELLKNGIHCSGFFTEEIRSKGHRTGFDVITTENNRGQLARVSTGNSFEDAPRSKQKTFRVGQYSVDVQSFEMTALPVLHYPTKEKEDCKLLYIIDEIGKMELFSQNFIQTVQNLMSQPNVILIATIPVPKGKPLPIVEELRNSASSQVFQITYQNRDNILSDILATVYSCFNTPIS